MNQQIKDFIDPLLKTQITDNIKLTSKPAKLNQQTGLITFLQGYCFESGFSVPPNADLATQQYLYGIVNFYDPLCAMQLEQSLMKHKKMKNVLHLLKAIQFVMLQLMYDMPRPKCKIDYQKVEVGLTDLYQLCKDTNLQETPLRKNIQLIIALCKFNEQPTQKSYEHVINTFKNESHLDSSYHLIIRLLSLQTQNANKLPLTIYETCMMADTNSFLTQCFYNLQVHTDNENKHVFMLRTLIYEHCYFPRSNQYDQIIAMLYQQQVKNTFHYVLTLRKYSKLMKRLQVQEIEFKFNKIINTPITYYLCGKLQQQGDLDESDCYMCKFKTAICAITKQPDLFTKFVYQFYDAKAILHHQKHNREELLPLTLFDAAANTYDTHIQYFNQVRTFQFTHLRKRIDKQKLKIALHNHKLEEQLKLKKQETLQLEMSRSKYYEQQVQKLQFIDEPKQIYNVSTSSVHKFLYSESKQRTIQGPTYGHQEDIQIKSSRFSNVYDEFNDLNFINLEYVQDIVFQRKSNRDGEIYAVLHQDNVYTMKTMSFLSELQIKEYFKKQQELTKLNHLNIRTLYGYCVQDLEQGNLSGSICIFYQKYEYNLKQYLHSNKLDVKTKWQIALQICDAVYYLHKNDIKYCNISPNNVLIHNTSKIPLLIDFELECDRETMPREYTCPELQNDDIMPNEQADVWSIGCLLLYLFFNIEFTFELELQNTTVTIDRFTKLNPWVSKQVDFKLPLPVDPLLEKIRTMIIRALGRTVKIDELLKEFYNNA